MESNINGRLVKIIDTEEGAFGLVVQTEHWHQVPCAPAFLGDDHYEDKLEKINLFLLHPVSILSILSKMHL